jgi:hypothetical protein
MTNFLTIRVDPALAVEKYVFHKQVFINISMKIGFKKSISTVTALLFCIAANSQEKTTVFKSGEIWPDTEGNHINAHGGGILLYNGTYFWFGEHRLARSEKDRTHYGVGCYSSKDLVTWKNEGLALQVVEDTASLLVKGCIIERPKVIYNKKTGKFVMWFHHELKGQGYRAALTGLAVSDNITGPYKYIRSLRPNAGVWPLNFTEEQKNSKVKESDLKSWSDEWRKAVKDGLFLRRDFSGGQMARDMTVFVDTDAKAYHIHSAEENQTLHISELTDDYTDFTGRYVRVLPGDANEAPAIFKFKGKYFMFSSGTTGWKPNPARVAFSKGIFKEWTTTGNPCRGTDEQNKITFGSQSTHVLPVGGKKNLFIFMGDRWVPENLTDSRYIWLPVEWEMGNPVIKWYPEWDFKNLK